uniref:Large ribosomal subunit protein P2 n=1 Tax=Dicentrarchus labrax TaxID=13489 RepID=A0A8P4KH45_DICLA
MRYVAAYLLAALGGNDNPEAKDIKKILESVGIEADDTRLGKVISELSGKNVNEVIATGECTNVPFDSLLKLVGVSLHLKQHLYTDIPIINLKCMITVIETKFCI